MVLGARAWVVALVAFRSAAAHRRLDNSSVCSVTGAELYGPCDDDPAAIEALGAASEFYASPNATQSDATRTRAE